MSSELIKYYTARAAEFEQIYELPERLGEIALLQERLPELLEGHDVLELACGTGYWTRLISLRARSIVATDASEEMLYIARSKSYPRNNVTFGVADALSPGEVVGDFTAGFVGFLWSHIELGALRPFLEGLYAKLGSGKLVVFVDNTAGGTQHAFTRRDEMGNTYQTRRLKDGTEWEVLKNLPTPDELRAAVEGIGEEVVVETLEHYWVMTYRTA